MRARIKKSPAVIFDATPVTASPRGMRIAEAAAYIGGTVCFVRALIAEREVPALLLGKRHVILREDLDEYLDAQRRRA